MIQLSKKAVHLLLWPIRKLMKRLLKNESLKKFIVDEVNKMVDLPKLNEKQENDLFHAIVTALYQYLDVVL